MKKTSLSLCLLGGLALTGGCVNQNQLDALQARVMQQDQQIQQLNMQLSGVQPAQADTWAQVQSLRQEMGAVKGQIDDFNNATAPVGGLAGLAQQVARHDAALRTVQTQFALDLQLDQPAAPGMTGGMPGGAPGDPFAGGQQEGGQPYGGEEQPPTQAPAQAPPVQNAAQNTAAASSAQKDTATALYDAGIASFNARKYKESLKSFQDFTDTFPKHRLASNAWFWRGESNFQLGNFAAAALDYQQVISQYPSSGKIASAYLKQGMSFAKAGKKDAAKVRYDELIKKFPKAPEATRAKQLLKEV